MSGTFSNLWCRVKTSSSSSSTVLLRKNAANGNETISITAKTAGAFSDSSHTDTTASGDLIDVAVTPGSIALIIIIIAVTFAANYKYCEHGIVRIASFHLSGIPPS